MDNDTKRAILNEMYRIHDEFLAGQDLACRIRCADCCTRNVTMTTVEGLNIVQSLDPVQQVKVRGQLESVAGDSGFRPAITVNGMADRCANKEDLPEEQLDPDVGRCPLLVDDRCSVYAVRPFECRAFVSSRVCRESGQADMSPLVVNTNNLLRQYIEHIDADGMSGNLVDVLLQEMGDDRPDLIANRSISVLMIDPGYQSQLDAIMEKLNTIRV